MNEGLCRVLQSGIKCIAKYSRIPSLVIWTQISIISKVIKKSKRAQRLEISVTGDERFDEVEHFKFLGNIIIMID